MKMDKWSENEKYIVMLSSKNASVRGVRHGYQAFLDYKKVKAALNVISNSGDSYTYNGNIYSTPITSSRAFQILGKIERCEWDEDIITVAKQIGANRMLSPRG
jgi:hypothetical protein